MTADGAYWDEVYGHGETTRSWFQPTPDESLSLLADAGVHPPAAVLDVGGGASTLVDALLQRGFPDVTVLDISAAGLQAARLRLGDAADAVQWVTADLTTWAPERTYDVWHDRALLHFFTTAAERGDYLRVLHEATHPGSIAFIGTFATDGPEQCSGLPTVRYNPESLMALLGDQWERVLLRNHQHTTPAGVTQSFTWVAARRGPQA